MNELIRPQKNMLNCGLKLLVGLVFKTVLGESENKAEESIAIDVVIRF